MALLTSAADAAAEVAVRGIAVEGGRTSGASSNLSPRLFVGPATLSSILDTRGKVIVRGDAPAERPRCTVRRVGVILGLGKPDDDDEFIGDLADGAGRCAAAGGENP